MPLSNKHRNLWYRFLPRRPTASSSSFTFPHFFRQKGYILIRSCGRLPAYDFVHQRAVEPRAALSYGFSRLPLCIPWRRCSEVKKSGTDTDRNVAKLLYSVLSHYSVLLFNGATAKLTGKRDKSPYDSKQGSAGSSYR